MRSELQIAGLVTQLGMNWLCINALVLNKLFGEGEGVHCAWHVAPNVNPRNNVKEKIATRGDARFVCDEFGSRRWKVDDAETKQPG